MFSQNKNLSSFTLIELLVVLALVAILSVVVVMTLNPAELIKQARDSNRLSDLSTINTALNLFSADVTSGFMGTSTVIYVSIPDNASSTCGSLGLPTLPAGYIYNCVTTANLRNTNGTGWIPVNFQRISSNSPISQLPIDPINTTSTRLYYTYATGGSWELNATIEASKNKLGGSGDLVSKDGGNATSQYEIGNNLNLNPLETGDSSLVGYWNFEEGPNATSTDRSGYGNHGAWNGTSTAQQHYDTGKVGSYSGYFNGSGDRIVIPATSSLQLGSGAITLSFLINASSWSTWQGIFVGGGVSGVPGYGAGLHSNGLNMNYSIYGPSGGNQAFAINGPIQNQWLHVVVVFDVTNRYIKVYKDGVMVSNNPISNPGDVQNSQANFIIGSYSYLGGSNLSGYLDDIRVYNRALSAAEISALYNATK